MKGFRWSHIDEKLHQRVFYRLTRSFFGGGGDAFLIHNENILEAELISVLCPPSSLCWPQSESEYEHFLQRTVTVSEYLLKREECALICQGDLS